MDPTDMGKAIQIIKINEDENHTCYLDEVALKRIILVRGTAQLGTLY